MLKINLLPKSINAAKQRNVAIAVVAIVIAAEVGALIYMRNPPLQTAAQLNDRKAQAESERSQLQQIGTQSAEVLAEEAKFAPKYNFLTGMIAYNKAYPSLYRRIASYTFSEVMLLNLEATSNTVKFDAYVSNPTDVSRLLLGLSRSPDIQGLPTISGVPGWDEAEQAKRRQDERAQLEQSNQSALPGEGSSIIGQAGSDLPPGSGGGYPAAGGGGGGNGPGIGGGYPSGGGNGPSGGGDGGASSGGNGPGGGGGYPGGEGGGTSGTGDLSKLRLQLARLRPKGFTINVSCALKSPILPLTYGTSATQGGAAGGGGGYPGGGGNSPS